MQIDLYLPQGLDHSHDIVVNVPKPTSALFRVVGTGLGPVYSHPVHSHSIFITLVYFYHPALVLFLYHHVRVT